jgi:NTE family protein
MIFRETNRLGPEHARASAAIPFLFRPVNIDGRLYCDGALRQSVPLSPALHLGADRLVVVSTQHHGDPPAATGRDRETAAGSPVYLLGKTANALTQDRIDDDLQRLETINDLLAAGEDAFGHDFVIRLNQALAERAARRALPPRQVHPVRTVLIRPSESLGTLAADYVRSRTFRTRNRGTVGRIFAQLGEWDSHQEADLLSYFLFDGRFADTLMRLGRADAQKQAGALAALFGGPTAHASSSVAPS